MAQAPVTLPNTSATEAVGGASSANLMGFPDLDMGDKHCQVSERVLEVNQLWFWVFKLKERVPTGDLKLILIVVSLNGHWQCPVVLTTSLWTIVPEKSCYNLYGGLSWRVVRDRPGCGFVLGGQAVDSFDTHGDGCYMSSKNVWSRPVWGGGRGCLGRGVHLGSLTCTIVINCPDCR